MNFTKNIKRLLDKRDDKKDELNSINLELERKESEKNLI